ncbi:Hsp20/alpha crystallin family protein [Nitzschia inconspicua]|uniref:Hsp20/alpha crystallin family protein n=1 Tax=Nitzschia inconspicua TaxID=303405 RepID=A0A9K3LFR8_9STRA|nr:Hsp20/alpha crystallin family protein [Nitzschia inconspicua]
MFFVLHPVEPSSTYSRNRRGSPVKHRVGRYHRFHPHYPNMFIDLVEGGNRHSRWVPHRRCAVRPVESGGTGTIAALTKNIADGAPATPSERAGVMEKASQSQFQKEKETSKEPGQKETESTENSLSTRYRINEKGNVVMERTPVHRKETEDEATISMDVSGFSVDQLQVRLEEEQGDSSTTRPILIVSGARENSLGDKFEIHRRFLLDQKNLAKNIQEVEIQAHFSNDSVLTIRVPKKKQEPEEKQQKISRSIIVQKEQSGEKTKKPDQNNRKESE